MKKIFLLILLLLFYTNLFAAGNIERYMFVNNMKYPYNFNADINKSYIVDFEAYNEDEGGEIENYELTYEQKAVLIQFFEKLNTIDVVGNFSELKNQKNVIAFSINNIYLYYDYSGYKSINVDVLFYLNINDNLPGAVYNDEYQFWVFSNAAMYSIDDYGFIGFFH